MTGLLTPILEDTRKRIEFLAPLVELRARAADAAPVRSFEAALRAEGLGVIAEVKRRSPSRGEFAPDLDPVAQAQAYATGGAAAISVLTEPFHFSGSDADLQAVRATVAVPVLRKDFTLVPGQIWEARAIGADAVLLIVAALDDVTLRLLAETAAEVGVAALVEVHDQAEAERALDAGSRIIGVNNRNLHTFEVDLGTSEALAGVLETADITIAESGIHTAVDAARMAAAGFDAVLVGESLVRAPDPAKLLETLRSAGVGR
jgi:indole-3-glycerol phosphate synthase